MIRVIGISLALLLLGAPISSAQKTTDEIQSLASSLELELKLKPMVSRVKKGKIQQKKLQIIWTVLSATSEFYIHRLNGADDNEIFVHKDGHKEAVYDKAGNLVQDGINDGSYNYFHPDDDPLRHFAGDIHPWILWGISPKDPTTPVDRISAYVMDVINGGQVVIQQGLTPRTDVPPDWNEPMGAQAAAVFLEAIELGGAEDFFKLFNGEVRSIDRDSLVRLLRALERGFLELYMRTGLVIRA